MRSPIGFVAGSAALSESGRSGLYSLLWPASRCESPNRAPSLNAPLAHAEYATRGCCELEARCCCCGAFRVSPPEKMLLRPFPPVSVVVFGQHKVVQGGGAEGGGGSHGARPKPFGNVYCVPLIRSAGTAAGGGRGSGEQAAGCGVRSVALVRAGVPNVAAVV